MIEIKFLDVAETEYETAADWYAERSIAAADRFAAEVETAIESIRKNPEQNPRWDDRYRFRMVDRFPYYVAYRQTTELIVIVAIRHAAQDQGVWTGR